MKNKKEPLVERNHTKMVRQQEARLVEKHAFHAREGPRVRGLRTRLVAEERVDAGDGGGGRDKGHSRGRFSPRSSPPSCLFSPFFSLPERLRDHRVSRRCRFDDSEHLMDRTTPGRRPREALSPGPRNAARHATPFFSIDRASPRVRRSCGSPHLGTVFFTFDSLHGIVAWRRDEKTGLCAFHDAPIN